MNRIIGLLSLIVLVSGSVLGAEIDAEIVYNFENTNSVTGSDVDLEYPEPDTNTFVGIVVGPVTTDDPADDYWGRFEELTTDGTIEAGVCDRGVNGVISFDVDINDVTTVDFTHISFDTSYRNNFTKVCTFEWTFLTSIAGVTNEVATGTYTADSKTYETENSDIDLTDLADLTDTTVTFIWSYYGSRNNTFAKLAMGLDDVNLTGTFISKQVSLIMTTSE